VYDLVNMGKEEEPCSHFEYEMLQAPLGFFLIAFFRYISEHSINHFYHL